MQTDIQTYAHELLLAEGFVVDLPPAAQAELTAIAESADQILVPASDESIVDLTDLPWSSIDNPETRDVDQLEYVERVAGGTRVMIAIADVDAFVAQGSALDRYAAQNTTSIYGGDVLLPMLPRQLSEGLTSLLPGVDRLAIVAEFVVSDDGGIHDGAVSRALVRNGVQLNYAGMNAWLEGRGELPAAAAGLQEQLHLQNETALRLRQRRELLGALEFERDEVRPVMENGSITGMVRVRPGPARDLIEDFMVAANATIAGFLELHDVAWIRRMVGQPRRWRDIVEVVAAAGGNIPGQPDRVALGTFLREARDRDPENFGALSLSVLRLLGSGAYLVEHRAEDLGAHFALGVEDYTHFTAPNRRYADVIMQRIVKAVLAGEACPYSDEELEAIAHQCSRMEDLARAVQRKVVRRAALLLMEPRTGEVFEAVVTEVTNRRARIRLADPVIEGSIESDAGLLKGAVVRVHLAAVDVAAGSMEFTLAADAS